LAITTPKLRFYLIENYKKIFENKQIWQRANLYKTFVTPLS